MGGALALEAGLFGHGVSAFFLSGLIAGPGLPSGGRPFACPRGRPPRVAALPAILDGASKPAVAIFFVASVLAVELFGSGQVDAAVTSPVGVCRKTVMSLLTKSPS